MRHHVLSVALVAFLVLLGGCGGDDDDAATTAGDGAATTGGDGAGTTIDATASEFQFEPNSWTVPAGQPFTVQFENGGTTEHEWVVIALGEDLESEADLTEGKILFEIEELPAGETTTQEFTIDEAGTYQVICAVPSHFDSGMEGSLVVE